MGTQTQRNKKPDGYSTVTISGGGREVTLTEEQFRRAAENAAEKPKIDNTRIKKVGYKKGKTSIAWEKENEKGEYDEFTMTCMQVPKASFFTALSALKPHVMEMCEFPDEYQDNIDVTGVSYSFSNGVMGATITALKTLQYSTSPLVINTPHKPAGAYSEGGDDANCLSDLAIKALELVASEAEQYLRGDRAQAELPLDGEPEADDDDGQEALPFD